MQLEGQQACATSTLGFNPASGPEPGLRSLSGLSGIQFPPANTVAGFVLKDVDTYEFGFDQLDFQIFGPANRLPRETPVYHQYLSFEQGPSEFAIYRNVGGPTLDWATLGYFAIPTQICFYGVGVAVFSPPTSGTKSYNGIADGVQIGSGEPQRLFGSVATLTYNFTDNTASVTVELVERDNAFANFLLNPSKAGKKLAGSGTGSPSRFQGTLSDSSSGLAGTFVGSLLGPEAKGGEIAFALSDASGVKVMGSGAFGVDAN